LHVEDDKDGKIWWDQLTEVSKCLEFCNISNILNILNIF
jgi:hypothetical protein